MAIIGGNTEKKEIGLPIDISGTHRNTEVDKITGNLQLVQIDLDGQGNSIYADEGTWTSDVVNLGDKFQDFEKVFTTHVVNKSTSFAILTRVSDNGHDWSDWTAIAMDGTIQSDTKQYIQIKIDLFAGFVNDVFIIAKSDFEDNKYVEQKPMISSGYATPTLTSNTSSLEGFPFALQIYNTSYDKWMAFDKNDSKFYLTSVTPSGILGFYFSDKKLVSKYKIKTPSTTSYLKSMPKDWILQGSNDTTTGLDGTWENLDTQTNQIWTTVNTEYEYIISNKTKYSAYRVNWSDNGGNKSYSCFGELDFYEEGSTAIRLKRDYEFDMTLDSKWVDTGSLHRQKIARSEWLRIDSLEVKNR